MGRSREQILAREARWRLPTALASLVGVALLVGSVLAITDVKGDGAAEVLREVDRHGSSVVLSGVLRAVGFFLLGLAPIYLFRAASARSEKVRSQLLGLLVAAPIFLALGSGLNAAATTGAADEFVSGEASASLTRSEAAGECREERRDEGAEEFAEEHRGGAGPLAECAGVKVEDDAAEAALSGGFSQLTNGLQLAGSLAFAFGLLYSCLHAMRTGLLTRFWGSLGMALAVAVLLPNLIVFTLVWFVYFSLFLLGWVPGGRPPAWAAGEAVPWPSPGEKAAAELQGEGDEPDRDPAGEDQPERRKRKQRD